MIIPFGKRHKGKEMAQVFNEDPEYIEWIANYRNEGNTFKISDRMREEAKQLLGVGAAEFNPEEFAKEESQKIDKLQVLQALEDLKQVISEM